jgi:zinc protease
MLPRRLIALLSLTVSCLAHAGVNIQHWTTPAGARVYFVESRSLPILDLEVAFAAGSAYDPPGKAGLASLTQGLLDGGAGDLDEEQIAGKWVDLGARLGGGTDSDRATVSLRTLTSSAERTGSLDLLRTLLSAPTFPAEVLARERGRAVAALKEADTRPDAIASKAFVKAVYPNHPYGVVTTEASLQSISRDDLVSFHRTYFGARNAVISIVGDLSRADAEAIAGDLSASLPGAATAEPLPPITLPKRETIRITHPASQAHIDIGTPGYARGDVDSFPLFVGNYVLGGGGFVSRLMQDVREKRGLAYDVHSYFAPRKLAGPFEIGLQTKREQAAESLAVVEATLTKFLKEGPSAAELKAAKQNLADGFGLRLDSNAKLLGNVSMVGFYGLPLTWIDDYPRNIEAVTAAQVRAAFAKHLDQEHIVTVIVAGE